MNRSRWTAFAAAAVAAATLSACDTTQPSLVSDAEVNADVAASAGDAMALAVANMVVNENAALPSGSGGVEPSISDGSITYSRSRVCYDEAGVVVTNCSPVASVRTVVTHAQLDGSRSWTSDDESKSASGAVHRVSDDSLTRVFNGANETQRVHNDRATAHDTLTVTGDDKSKFFAEDAVDSVKAVTFALPRSSNPWPVSGSIVRNLSVNVIVTKGTETETRSVTRRIQVTFPADAQGNVVLMVNTTTCNLNLVTGRVTGCSS